jgi:hypothetical protein
MNTLEDIEKFNSLKSKHEDAVREIKKFLTLTTASVYFNGHQSRDIPAELIDPIRNTCVKYFMDKASETLNQLEFLNFDVSKEKEALKLMVL